MTEPKLKKSKRGTVVYTVIALWIVMGILAIQKETPLPDLAVYFTSLTGFIGIYVWGETKKRSKNSIMKLQTSKRQLMIYVSILLWAVLGIFGIHKQISLIEASTYFAALTPFVGAYIIGSTLRPTNKHVTEDGDEPPSDADNV